MAIIPPLSPGSALHCIGLDHSDLLYSVHSSHFCSPLMFSSPSASSLLSPIHSSVPQVIVRIRPLVPSESADAALPSPIDISPPNSLSLSCSGSDRRQFTFDRVFDSLTSQSDVMSSIGERIVDSALKGMNGAILCYGQTGSGKTFTMMGNNSGMMQRSFAELFARIDRMADTECIVTCSYYELYNEQIIDLLDKTR